MTVVINLAEMSDIFFAGYCSHLQGRNQFCPIKWMAKKSLVYLLCFLQLEYFNFFEFANAAAITTTAKSTKLCFLQPDYFNFVNSPMPRPSPQLTQQKR
jgi:hypothetical protein